LIIGNMVVVLVEDFAGIPRRPLIGGLVGAALFVTMDLRFGFKPVTDPLMLPLGALSGFALGALLSAPPVRFPLAGGLLVALPTLLIGLVYDLISRSNSSLAMIVTLGLSTALLTGIGWLLGRSTAWAIGGAIAGLLFASMLRAMPSAQVMFFTKAIAMTFGLAGAVVGAVVGIRSMDMAWPKLLARTKE
jgi:hypothetical protein